MQQEIWFQKYRILGLLGRGGTAEVYLAEHIKLNSYRAIKFISKNHPLYDLQRKEAYILKSLKHSCIPIIYDIEENEDGSYIIEQYLEGYTLKEYFTRQGNLSETLIVKFGIQLCDLIHYLHSIDRPILYVDLKPENILVSDLTLKLIDFGSALFSDESTEHQDYFATKGYAAPELYHRNRIDERCDIFGIGMLLYYMCTGEFLNNDSCIKQMDDASSWSKQLKRIIYRCIRHNPSQRYASVAVLKLQLSAMIRKHQTPTESSHVTVIAIAGAQHRVGVTHFALRLCNYYRTHKLSCLYQEKNDTACVSFIRQCYNSVKVKDGIYEINQIPMLAAKQKNQPLPEAYRVIVQDYGCITRENIPEFEKAQVKLLILGAKDWELNITKQVLNMMAEYKEIVYLFNFINGRQFQQLMKNMDGNCFRIPYEPDPFLATTNKNEEDLFQELFNPVQKKTFKSKMVQIFMKGKNHDET